MKLPFLTEKQLLNEFNKYGVKLTPLLKKALIQTKKTHKAHLRDDAISPVLEQHIYPLVNSLISCYKYEKRKINSKVIVSAVLHDVIEDDCNMNNNKFRRIFGYNVYKIVKCVTKKQENNKPDLPEEEIYKINKKMIEELQESPYEAKIIKLADRYNNLSCSLSAKYKNIKKYERRIIETRELFLPFAKEVSPYFYKKIKSALRELA